MNEKSTIWLFSSFPKKFSLFKKYHKRVLNIFLKFYFLFHICIIFLHDNIRFKKLYKYNWRFQFKNTFFFAIKNIHLYHVHEKTALLKPFTRKIQMRLDEK